jgi:hypothetical protein
MGIIDIPYNTGKIFFAEMEARRPEKIRAARKISNSR